MTQHDFTKSPDDCPRCQEGYAPDRIDAVRCREHLAAMAATPVPIAAVKTLHAAAAVPIITQWAPIERRAHEAGRQAVAELRAKKATIDNPAKKAAIDTKAIYAARAQAMAAPPKPATNTTIDANAIYARRASAK